ncbi:hypothetical protein [Streptomyces sp. NPDC055299]
MIDEAECHCVDLTSVGVDDRHMEAAVRIRIDSFREADAQSQRRSRDRGGVVGVPDDRAAGEGQAQLGEELTGLQ